MDDINEDPGSTRQDIAEYREEVTNDTRSVNSESNERQDEYNSERDIRERDEGKSEVTSVNEPNITDDDKHGSENNSEVGDDNVSYKTTSEDNRAEQQRNSEPTRVKEEDNSENQTPKQTRNEQNQSKPTWNSYASNNNEEKGKTTKKKRAVSASPSMSSLRSSVRPKSSKQPWGTIMQPEFGLGYQKMTEYEIAQTVDRLYKIPTPKERVYDRPGKKLNEEEYDEMMQRMTKIDIQKIPDSDRRVQSSIYNRMGVVSSYAWKGYN